MSAANDPKSLLERILSEGLARVAPNASGVDVQIERPRNPEHGDYSCNLALQLARALKRKPREIAQQLLEAVAGDIASSRAFEPLEMAGAGFINARLSPEARETACSISPETKSLTKESRMMEYRAPCIQAV